MATLDHASNPADLVPGTLAELFITAVEARRDQVAFRHFPGEGPELVDISYGEALEWVRAVVGGLRALGVERGNRAAILSENRPEWAFVDYGCICAGVWDVPIYATLTQPQVAYILGNSSASLIFTSTPQQMEKAVAARARIDGSPQIVVFDAPEQVPEGGPVEREPTAQGDEQCGETVAGTTEPQVRCEVVR